MTLNWLGNDVAARARRAAKSGVDGTLAACVTAAQQRAPVDTGFLKNTIDFQPAQRQGSETVGYWGNWVADYALWQEIGSQGRSGRYFLRQSADQEYPKLGRRIQAAFVRGGR